LSILRLTASFIITLLVSACAPAPADEPAEGTLPIVVQGAMPVETQVLVSALQGATQVQAQGWTFWAGSIDNYPVVVSRTQKGMTNAAAATTLAIERFHPSLHVLDIVVGTQSVNIGAFKTGSRAVGQGTNFDEWRPMDLIRTEGSAGQDPNAWVMHRFEADPALLGAADAARDRYTEGRVVRGVIGSSDVWNSELDRIARLHAEYGTSVEEMEAASAAQVAGMSQVPFIGIRVLSNNITNEGAYNGASAAACQRYVLEVVKAYIARLRAS
jgi:adenosylhomocysteine nucleosidase